MKRSTLNNSLSAIILQVVIAISGIILPKLLIDNYGSSINGMISSVTQFIGYLALVEAGVGNVSIVKLYKPLAENNISEVNGILSATNKYYKKSGVIFVLLVGLLLVFYPPLINDQLDNSLIVWMIIILSMSSAFDYFFLGKYRVLLTSDQKIYVLNYIQCLGTFLNIVITILLVYLNQSILVVKLWATIIYVMRIIIIYIYIKTRYKYLDLAVEPLTDRLNDKWSVLSHQIAGMVVLNTGLIVLTLFHVPLTEISVFSIYNMIVNVIIGLLNALLSSLTPIFGKMHVTHSYENFKENYMLYEFYFYILTFTLFTCLIVLFLPFLKMYTINFEGVNYIRNYLVLGFSAFGLIYMIRTPVVTIINSVGHYQQTKNGAFIEAGINIFVSVISVGKFGVFGIVLANICSHLFRTIELIIYTNKNIVIGTIKSTLFRIIRNLFLLIVLVYIFNRLISFTEISMISWVIKAGLIFVSAFFSFLIYNIIFEKKYICIINELVKNIIRRK
ncbi:MAG: hypothetical protein WBO70_05305 [Erysipelotrichaceae bacterium]